MASVFDVNAHNDSSHKRESIPESYCARSSILNANLNAESLLDADAMVDRVIVKPCP